MVFHNKPGDIFDYRCVVTAPSECSERVPNKRGLLFKKIISLKTYYVFQYYIKNFEMLKTEKRLFRVNFSFSHHRFETHLLEWTEKKIKKRGVVILDLFLIYLHDITV